MSSLGEFMMSQLQASIKEKERFRSKEKNQRLIDDRGRIAKIAESIDVENLRYELIPEEVVYIVKDAAYYYLEGHNLDETAEYCGLTRSIIHKYLLAIGLPLRNFSFVRFPITVVSKNGKPIGKTYESIAQCGKELNISHNTIIWCLKNKTHTYNGYCLEIEGEPDSRTYKEHPKEKSKKAKEAFRLRYKKNKIIPTLGEISKECDVKETSAYNILRQLKREWKVK